MCMTTAVASGNIHVNRIGVKHGSSHDWPKGVWGGGGGVLISDVSISEGCDEDHPPKPRGKTSNLGISQGPLRSEGVHPPPPPHMATPLPYYDRLPGCCHCTCTAFIGTITVTFPIARLQNWSWWSTRRVHVGAAASRLVVGGMCTKWIFLLIYYR